MLRVRICGFLFFCNEWMRKSAGKSEKAFKYTNNRIDVNVFGNLINTAAATRIWERKKKQCYYICVYRCSVSKYIIYTRIVCLMCYPWMRVSHNTHTQSHVQCSNVNETTNMYVSQRLYGLFWDIYIETEKERERERAEKERTIWFCSYEPVNGIEAQLLSFIYGWDTEE